MLVKIANMTPQLLTVSVHQENGELREIKLEGRQVSEAFEDSTISDHTRQLVGLRHLKLRPA